MFDFSAPVQVIFGCGSAQKTAQILRSAGRKVLLVTGKNSDRYSQLTDLFSTKKFKISHFIIESEPTTDTISKGVEFARSAGCDVVAGIGGGSVIDSAKAIAALVPNRGETTDYLEVIGSGRNMEEKPLPFVAIPTTAGTGAEVTKNAVIHSPEHRVKVSLRSPLMYPTAAVVDPELTLSMPPEITASTGMDALSHLLESFVSNQSNPFIDTLCREGMRRISLSLKKAFENGADIAARENMAFASLLGGMALANVKLGAVHGFAGPLGGMYPAAHGSLCAALLPAVMEVNLRVAIEQNQQATLTKFDALAQILTGRSEALANDGVHWMKNMVNYLKIPALSASGLTRSDFPSLVEKAKKASSMQGNPVMLNDDNLLEIITKSF